MSKIFFRKNRKSNKTSTSRHRHLDLNRDLDFSESSFCERKMADINIDTVMKALRLVPDFDGNPNILTRFLRLCDQIVTEYSRPGQDLVDLALLNGILNKIVGPAARLINSNGIPNDWQGIRSALINNFADQRDETALYNDLALLTQGSSTPQEFYERCQNLFSTIMTYISLHEALQTTIDSKRDLYQKLTLQAFLRGLKDPLGSRIRCMRPPTIEKALEYIHEEMNTLYLQSRNENFTDSRKPPLQKPLNQFLPPIRMPNQPAFNNFNMPGNNFNMPGPSRPQPVFNRPPPPQVPPRFNYPSRTQQMFSAPPPNYQHSNAFRTPNRGFQPVAHNGPKPMSGVSHYVSRGIPPTPPAQWNWARQGNPPPTSYFKTRDVNLNECSNYANDYYNYDDYNNYYNDTYDYYTTDMNDCTYYYDSGYTIQEIPTYDNDVSTMTRDDVQATDGQPSSEDFPKSPPSDRLK